MYVICLLLLSSDIEITSEVTGTAPIPVLNVGVRQDGTLIDDELNVKPGTPLNMEVYLDSESSEVYGLMVTGMEVTDTRDQTEPILVNGYESLGKSISFIILLSGVQWIHTCLKILSPVMEIT